MPPADPPAPRPDLRTRLQQRLDQIRGQLLTTRNTVTDLEAELTRARDLVKRQEGAILVLEELAQEVPDTGERPTPAPAARPTPEVRPEAPRVEASAATQGRNAPCPCGSGRKYKLCHEGKPLPQPTQASGQRAEGEEAAAAG